MLLSPRPSDSRAAIAAASPVRPVAASSMNGVYAVPPSRARATHAPIARQSRAAWKNSRGRDAAGV
jgi:hypothetical protein